MKYEVGDVVIYTNSDVMLYGHCEYLIVDIDYNWGCPSYIVRTRYDQGKRLSEKRYKVQASLLDKYSELLKSSETYKEENEMTIEHTTKAVPKIKTNLELIRELDANALARFLLSHRYVHQATTDTVDQDNLEELETWLLTGPVDAETTCNKLRELQKDNNCTRDTAIVLTNAISYVEGAEALKKEVAEISGVSAKAAKMIQDLVAQYLP